MKVFKLGFLSLPKETIHIFNSEFISSLNSKIGYDLSKDIVKILSDELVKANSLEGLKKICISLEKDNNFLESI